MLYHLGLKHLTTLTPFVVVQSDSLRLYVLQRTRLSCFSLSPGVCSDSCPLSWWCHPTISSSVVPLSSCPQSFSASVSFPNELALCIRWPKYWSFSISPSNEFSGWFPSELTDLIPLLSKGFSRVFSNTTVQKPSLWQFSSICPMYTWLLEKSKLL